jgi:hypothetical protein
MKTITTLMLLILLTGCTAMAPYDPVADAIKNKTLTVQKLCSKLSSHMHYGLHGASKVIRDEIASRNVLSPLESSALLYGYKSSGFVGFSREAFTCRFVTSNDGSSQSGSRRYDWLKVYAYGESHGITRVMLVNGVVANTYSDAPTYSVY